MTRAPGIAGRPQGFAPAEAHASSPENRPGPAPRGTAATRETLALAAATLVAGLVVVVDTVGLPTGPVRAVAGLYLAAFAPGAALVALVRPAFLARTARAVLAVPASLAVAAVAGALVDRTPLGLTPVSAAATTFVVTAMLLLAALLRWRPGGPRPRPDASEGPDDAAPPADAAAVDAADARGPGGSIARLVRLAVDHVRDPLFLNAYALGLSGVLTSGLGVVYWAVAARLYPADIVGVNASLLSLVTLLANVSQLNLRSGFGRYVPVAGTRTARLVHGGYLAALALAAATGLGVVAILAFAPSVLADIRLTPLLAWLFPLTVILWTAFTVQDHALVAFRRTAIVPVENGVFALAKVILLVPLAAMGGAYGILVSWTLPTAIGVVIVSGWVLARLVPREQRRHESLASADPASVDPTTAGAPPVTAGEVVRYVGADYVGSLLSIGSTSILPVLVLATLGATSSAHFYMVGMIAMATQLVPSVLATSLLVEVASSKATFDVDGRRVLRQLAVLLGPIVVVLLLFADPILRIFGASYAAEGATALRLLALAGIPYSLINMAFIRMRLEGRVRWVVVAQGALAVLLVGPALLVLGPWGVTGLGIVTLASQTFVAVVLAWAELRPLLLLGLARDPLGMRGARRERTPADGEADLPDPRSTAAGDAPAHAIEPREPAAATAEPARDTHAEAVSAEPESDIEPSPAAPEPQPPGGKRTRKRSGTGRAKPSPAPSDAQRGLGAAPAPPADDVAAPPQGAGDTDRTASR